MTVQSTITSKTFYPGGALATQSLAGLVFLSPDHVRVEVLNADGAPSALLARDEDYTLSGDGATGAASITPTAAWAPDVQWYVSRRTETVQPEEFPVQQPLSSLSVERGLNRSMLIAQEQAAALGRAPLALPGQTPPAFNTAAIGNGQVLARVGDMIVGVDNDPASAADSAAMAAAERLLAEGAHAAAVVAQSNAETARDAAGNFRDESEAARNAANGAAVAAQQYFPGARLHVPQGAVTGAATISTAGTGGTNGTFDLAFSGGNFAVNPTGTFTVSGGAVTAITITGPGLYIGNAISKPTLSFAASTGLTGAAGTFNTVYLKTAGNTWLTDTDPPSAYLSLFRNESNAAVEIDAQFDPMSAGAAADAVASIANVASDAAVAATAVYRQQLFNPAASTDGFFVAADGALSANTNYFASDWMDWASISQVCIAWANYIVQATESGGVYTAVSGTYVNPNSAAYVLNKHASATHFRISGQKGNISAAVQMVVRGSTLPADYIPYDQVIDGSKVRPKTLTGTALASGTVTPDKVSFLSASKNLFNVATILPNYFMGATGALTANSTYGVSDYIPVTPGQTYVSSQNGVLSNLRMWCFFANTSGTVVAGGSNSDGSSFTVPTGANYVRVTQYNSRLTGAQIELGSTPTSWVKYGYTLNPDGYSSSSGGGSGGWSGKKWGRLGDSITAARPWASTTAQVLGLTALDYGVGGTQVGGPSGSTTAMFSDDRINAMDSTLDLITFMGGTNDWFNNRALGAVTSTNSEEFNGALNLMAEKLINRYPDKLVVFFTPIWTHALTWASKSWSNAYTNTLGLTPRDYADAIAACGKRYNIPVVDLMARLSWNRLNITTYVADDGELLHPNTAGNNRMAQIYVGGLSELAPVA